MNRYKIILSFIFFLFCINYISAQGYDISFYNTIVAKFEPLQSDEKLAYMHVDNGQLQFYSVNEQRKIRRDIGEFDRVEEWRGLQFSYDRKYCMFTTWDYNENYESPIYLINGISGEVTYILDAPVPFCMSGDGKYLLFEMVIEKKRNLSAFNGVIFDINKGIKIREINWPVREDKGVGFNIIREGNTKFKVFYTYEGRKVGAVAIVDVNTGSVRTLWDRTAEDVYDELPESNADEFIDDVTWTPRNPDINIELAPSAYMPSKSIEVFTITHTTLDSLRIRDNADTSGKIVTTLPQDTAVQLLETGQETTIDGITAPWVRVLSSTGYEGWCFSGYLEPIAAPPSPSPEPPAIEPYTADPPPLVESTAHTFPWIWIAGGGALLLGAGVIIIIAVKGRSNGNTKDK